MTLNHSQILESNQQNYVNLYSEHKGFLRYPADWIIRFHNMYMKDNLPSGRVLDYGCGGGNNTLFFVEQGYETYGCDVSKESLDLLRINLESRGMDPSINDRYSVISPDNVALPYEDGYFDFILSNQVLYYLPSEEHIKKVCRELHRCLKPGGTVFFTMLGPKNYYITDRLKTVHDGKIHEITIEEPEHRLSGLRELIYLVESEQELKDLFSDFDCLTTGYFDQKMFDIKSNFHWIFAGTKA